MCGSFSFDCTSGEKNGFVSSVSFACLQVSALQSDCVIVKAVYIIRAEHSCITDKFCPLEGCRCRSITKTFYQSSKGRVLNPNFYQALFPVGIREWMSVKILLSQHVRS